MRKVNEREIEQAAGWWARILGRRPDSQAIYQYILSRVMRDGVLKAAEFHAHFAGTPPRTLRDYIGRLQALKIIEKHRRGRRGGEKGYWYYTAAPTWLLHVSTTYWALKRVRV